MLIVDADGGSEKVGGKIENVRRLIAKGFGAAFDADGAADNGRGKTENASGAIENAYSLLFDACSSMVDAGIQS